MENRQFARKRVHHEARISAPLDKVFPLLCPVREYEWIDGWNCQIIGTDSGFAEKGAVFTTGFRAEGDAIWTVSRYEPDSVIEFVVVFPDSHVLTIALTLEPIENNQTRLGWNCVFTSLTENNTFVDEMTQEAFDRQQSYFDKALDHYCTTGQMLRRDSAKL